MGLGLVVVTHGEPLEAENNVVTLVCMHNVREASILFKSRMQSNSVTGPVNVIVVCKRRRLLEQPDKRLHPAALVISETTKHDTVVDALFALVPLWMLLLVPLLMLLLLRVLLLLRY